MNTAVVVALVVVVVAASAEAKCPLVACTLEIRPGMTQHAQTMDYNGESCSLCGKWLDNDVTAGPDGCPPVPCPRIAARCPRTVTFEFNGRQCPDCEADFC